MALPPTLAKTEPAHLVVDDWQPTPYTQRASQHVGFGAFATRVLSHLLIGGVSGTAIGWAIERTRPKGLFPYKMTFGLIGTLIGGFVNWRREEKSRLEADQMLNDFRKVPGLVRSNQEVTDDNVVLRKMVEFKQGQPPATAVAVGSIQREGAVAAENKELTK